MSVRSDKLLLAILNDYSSASTISIRTLAERNGVSVRSIFGWMRDRSVTVSEFMGKRDIGFGEAMSMARNVAKVSTVSHVFEDFVLNGRSVEVWSKDGPYYLDDEEAIAVEDLDTREMLFGYRDGKKRDANGNRIIATKIEYAPSQLIELYARANLPGIYGDKREITMKGGLNVGVTAIGAQRPLPPEVQAQIAAGGAVTETVKLPPAATSTIEQYEPEPEPEPKPVADEDDDLLGPEPVPAPPVERVIRDTPTEREKIAPATPKPMGIDEVPTRAPRNALEADLFRQLDAARNRPKP